LTSGGGHDKKAHRIPDYTLLKVLAINLLLVRNPEFAAIPRLSRLLVQVTFLEAEHQRILAFDRLLPEEYPSKSIYRQS
jgi:hypothetical protein